MKKFFCILCLLVIVFTGKPSEAQTGWSLQNNPLPDGTLLGKIQFVSPTEGWISANKGDLLHTTDAGATWIRVVPFPEDTVTSPSDLAANMSWVNQTHGWKMNWFGTGMNDAHGAVIHKTTDGGVTWEKQVLSTTEGDVGFQLQFVDENNGWAITHNFSSGNGSFLRTTDGGDNWSPSTGGGIFHFVDANNGWAFFGSGVDGSSPPFYITHTTNGGSDWELQYTDNTEGSIKIIQFTDLNNGWVIGKKGKIIKTTDGGSNWTPVTNTGINSESYSKCIFFLNATTGWIGTNIPDQQGDIQRVILHTTDGGSSWTMQNPQISAQEITVFSIFFWDVNNGWFTGDHCVQNCDGPDSLRVYGGTIGHYTGTTGVEENNNIPNEFSLLQNYPNPFNPTTVIEYSIQNVGMVRLTVYDILGQEVATLVNKEQTPGLYEVEFNAQNLTSGIYFYRLTVGSFSESKKLLLLR